MRRPKNPNPPAKHLSPAAAKVEIRGRLRKSTRRTIAAFAFALVAGVGSAKLAETGHDNAGIALEIGGIVAIAGANVVERQLARAKCEQIVDDLNQTGNPNAGHEIVELSVRSGTLEHGTVLNEHAVPEGTTWEGASQPLFTALGSFFLWAAAGEGVQPGAAAGVGLIGGGLFAIGSVITIYSARTNRQNALAYSMQVDTLANGPQILFEKPPEDRA